MQSVLFGGAFWSDSPRESRNSGFRLRQRAGNELAGFLPQPGLALAASTGDTSSPAMRCNVM